MPDDHHVSVEQERNTRVRKPAKAANATETKSGDRQSGLVYLMIATLVLVSVGMFKNFEMVQLFGATRWPAVAGSMASADVPTVEDTLQAAVDSIQHPAQDTKPQPVAAAHDGSELSPDTVTNPSPKTLNAAHQSTINNPASSAKDKCTAFLKLYNVVPDYSWGTLPIDLQAKWKSLRCDAHLKSLKPAEPTRGHLPQDYNLDPSANKIALCLGSTSRGVKNPSIKNLDLFVSFLPSVLRTLEAGFEFKVYVGYDKGDVFFDNPATLQKIHEWFNHSRDNLHKRTAEYGAELIMVPFNNVLKKPGPIFNHVTKAAFDDGVHFFYRLNDDSHLKTLWAKAMRDAVIGFGPPYGVVGPRCDAGNTKILTHDFVHRTHMEIFTDYYPPVFEDWYMDDWITRAYGRKRTL